MMQVFSSPIAFIFLSSQIVFAAPAQATIHVSVPTPQQRVEALIESIQSFDHAFILLRAANAAPEALKSIRAHINQSNAPMPRFLIKQNQLMANGFATGVKVVSYSPLRLNINGRIWNPPASGAADETYFSLVKLLSGKKSASLLSFPEARAQSIKDISTIEGAINGAALGWALITLVSAPVAVTVGVIAAGGFIGAGLYRYWFQENEKSAVEFLRGGLELECSPKVVALTPTDKASKARVLIYKNPEGGQDYSIFNRSGKDVTKETPFGALQLLRGAASECNSATDAAKLKSVVMEAMAARVPAPSTAGAKPAVAPPAGASSNPTAQ